jgi:hypothetical protein
VQDRSGNVVDNPLYSDLSCQKDNSGAFKDANGAPCQPIGARDPTFVFFAGIVGVPWQDIAVDPADLQKGYKSAKDINDQNIWKVILGDPTNVSGPILPTDTHMVESIGQRPGLPGPDSAANADPINGHEWDISKNGPPNADLQYACVFNLPTPTQCDTMNIDCDCNDATPGTMGGTVAEMKNPLCQSGNTYGHTQLRAKGYPGLRELQVMKGIGDQAIVASICPANVDPMQMNRSDFGYRPAINALVSRLRTALRGRCLPRTLEIGADKTVPCVIVEAFNPPAGQSCGKCEDDAAFRGRLTITDQGLITQDISDAGACLCEIRQLDGADLASCETQLNYIPTGGDGWCYVDPAQQGGDVTGACQVVSTCPDTDKRVIRFALDSSQPRPGATAFITCQEKSFPATSAGNTLMNPCPANP